MASTLESAETRLLSNLVRRIEAAWRPDTSADPARWTLSNPAWGQCAVTALVVQDFLGGTLLRNEIEGTSHYWNLLPSGAEIDLTRKQFPATATAAAEPEERSREYVLSFPETEERYNRLRERIAARL